MMNMGIERLNDGEEHIFKLVKNIGIDLGTYRLMPIYDEYPDLESYRSYDVPHPERGDYLLYKSGEITFFSDERDFSNVSFAKRLDTETIEDLLKDAVLQEISSALFQSEIELKAQISNLCNKKIEKEIQLDDMKFIMKFEEGLFGKEDIKAHENAISKINIQLEVLREKYNQMCKVNSHSKE